MGRQGFAVSMLLLASSALAVQLPSAPYTSISTYITHRDFKGAITLGSDSVPLTNSSRQVTGNTPEQVGLRFINDSSVTVTYVTGVPTIGPFDTNPETNSSNPSNVGVVASAVSLSTVAGKSAAAGAKYFFGSGTQYTQAYVAGNGTPFSPLGTSGGVGFGSFPAASNYTSGVIHAVTLTGLKPETTYYYTCGLREIGANAEKSFTTLPAVGALKAQVIGVFGDLGDTVNSSATIAQLIKADPDIILNTADFTYADTHAPPLFAGQDNGFLQGPGPRTTDQQRWDLWSRFMEPLISAKFHVGATGNHEIEPDGLGHYYQSYTARHGVANPYKESNSTSPLYFSFNHGLVHTVIVTNYLAFEPSSDMYKWFVNDMTKGLNRQLTPWVIVIWHAPVYNTVAVHYKENECMRMLWEPLLNEYGVDLVLHGHVHSYERTNPVNNYQTDPTGCAPTYITIGDGGNAEKLYNTWMDELNPATNFTYCPGVNSTGGTAGSRTTDPGTSASYQPAPNGTNYISSRGQGYCNSTSANNGAPGYGVPSNEPYCNVPVGSAKLAQPTWSAYRENSFGFGLISVSATGTDASWQWYRNRDGTPVVTDSVVFKRDITACPNRAFGAVRQTLPASPPSPSSPKPTPTPAPKRTPKPTKRRKPSPKNSKPSPKNGKPGRKHDKRGSKGVIDVKVKQNHGQDAKLGRRLMQGA